MDFSVLERAICAAQTQEVVPSASIQLAYKIDLSEAQRKKKENEMSHRAKTKRNKKIERSKGYLEKLEIKEKAKKKKEKKGIQKRKDKNPAKH